MKTRDGVIITILIWLLWPPKGAATVTIGPSRLEPRRIDTFTSLDDANTFQANGGQILRPNGTPYDVTPFQGGYLYDGLPLNVIMGLGWLPGQQEAIQGPPEIPPYQVPGVNPECGGLEYDPVLGACRDPLDFDPYNQPL
jgi:hypothetical protein